jgi:hypothetical protein
VVRLVAEFTKVHVVAYRIGSTCYVKGVEVYESGVSLGSYTTNNAAHQKLMYLLLTGEIFWSSEFSYETVLVFLGRTKVRNAPQLCLGPLSRRLPAKLFWKVSKKKERPARYKMAPFTIEWK